MAPVTTRVFNPLIRIFAGRLPGFAVMTHVGRITGRPHRTPLMVLRQSDQLAFVLWYGNAQWVRNVLAAGGCDIRLRGRDLRLVEPELVTDPERRFLPLPLRFAARLMRVTEFLRLRAA
jgi:deazaflavin-dependent oxidoreductase (nitroreductase family)